MNGFAHCGTTILFGGKKTDEQRYCSDKCMEQGQLAREAQAVPPEVLEHAVQETVQGDCPVCSGPGPVDVFTSYRVMSALVVTSWKSLPRISCRGCATKAQLGNTLYCLFLGWWGFPWGLVMTPVQIFRNLAGLSREAERERPSVLLATLVQARLAEEGWSPEEGVEQAPRQRMAA